MTFLRLIAKQLALLIALSMLAVAAPTIADAQLSLIGAATKSADKEATSMSQELAPLVDKAKKEGMSVVVISPATNAVVETAAPEMSMTEQGLMIRSKVKAIFANIPNIPTQFMATLRAASPDGSMNWLWYAIGIAVVGLVIGNTISWGVRKLIQPYFAYMYSENPESRAEKIGYLLFRAGMIAFNCAVMFVASMLLAVILDYGHEPSRSTIIVIVAAYVSYWIIRAVILFNIIAHDLPNHRMINLSDDRAKSLQYDMRNSMVAVIIAFAVCAWMDMLGLNRDAHKLFLITAMLIAAIIFGYQTIKHREDLRSVILGKGEVASKPFILRAIALAAPGLATLYLVASWIVSSFRLIMDLPSANLLVAAPMIAFFGALPIYGILLIIIDKIYQARRYRFDIKVRHARQTQLRELAAEQQARAEALAANPEAEADIVENSAALKSDDGHYPVFKPLFRPVLEQAAAIVVFLMAAGYVLSAWDVKVGDKGNPITGFMDTLTIAFIAWILYRAVIILVDNRLREETGADPSRAVDVDDEPAGHGSTRLGTLLPLLRNVSITAIAVIAGMIVLSNLGVDIAPLFAGAGVIGLAVGFGAQTLIRDIFSGGFFLFDDAFRKGEYIELGDIRGTVEKISLRSFQLRHHNGPLHTVPFGEIKQLTNYSRDWVIMKLPLRVTYDTDVDKVRKLVKKLGQQLLDHPDVGKNFIQPLKSQGVVQMEDSAMIIRVKFMTKPGDQWVTRKVVYAAIQDLFHKEGIHFANREVTVRIADQENGKLNEREREAVTGAARSVIDENRPAATVDDRG